MIKVAFISRSTLFSAPGGDTRQMEMTAKYLRHAGVHVDIHLTNEKIDYSNYELIHFFNITRPADIIKHIELSKKPFVISPIYVEYDRINEKSKGGVAGVVSKALSYDALSYVKSVARWVLNGEKIISKKYLLLGQTKSVKWIADRAARFLPNSENEMRRFSGKYGNRSYHVVPNGIDTSQVAKQYTIDEQYKGAVICVARFEPLKNQLSVIRALNNTGYRVFLHGKYSPNNKSYYDACVAEAGSNITIGDWLQGDDLYAVYANAKVHVLPSYFETTGLSSLEAAVMGCNIVVTDKGDQRDYFSGDAFYCNPDDVTSIKSAVDKAYATPYNESFRQRILKQFTWEQAAKETLTAYKQVLKL